MIQLLIRVFLFAAFFAVLPCNAQTDTIAAKANDSINSKRINAFKDRLTVLREQRALDSIKREKLEKQLLSLKTTDNLKKEELLEKIKQLNQNDEKLLADKKARIDALRHTSKAYPVKGFFNDTLFMIYSKQGSFTASERAKFVTDRVTKLGSRYDFVPDSLKIVDTENTVDLMAGAEIIASISQNDALWANTTQKELAKNYQKIISDAVMIYKDETSFKTLATEIGLAALVLAIMALIIFLCHKIFRLIAFRIIRRRKKLHGFNIKNYNLLDSRRLTLILLSVNKLIKWIVILLLIYFSLTVLFSIFPWTEGFAADLLRYIIDPLRKIAISVWNYLPKLITVIIIVTIFRYFMKLLRFFTNEINSGNLQIKGFYPDWANPTYQIVRILVYAFMLVVIYPYLPGSNSNVFKGVSVFLGFLFTFGSAGSLSNIVSGLMLTYMRLFRINDRVKIGDVIGDVIEKTVLVTRIRTIKNEIISIPNATVMSSHTINYSSDAQDRGLIINSKVTVGYDVPWPNVHKALIEAAKRTDLLMEFPAPYVYQTSLDDFYVSYEINAYTRDAHLQDDIYSQLRQNIQDTFKDAAIELMSPHYIADRGDELKFGFNKNG
ncbi:MAG: mechanosensitive ion channel [Flavobacterium sp.]|nr:MAG: mechanosensitive ion channel [Flavobacterium sp.]